MVSIRTLQQQQKRVNLHNFVVRQINAGRGAREVLADMTASAVGSLVTYHKVAVVSPFGGPSNYKEHRITTLCLEVYDHIKPEYRP
jgi:hypothetical protein